jgi:uncharacterized phage infection (PIP) family protein YhgE
VPQGIGKLDIPQVWQNLSQGQGTVIAAMITVIAALGGVVLGWLLFSGRVRNLETALSTSESKVQDHLRKVESALKEYESTVNDQLSSLSQQLSQLSGSVADIPTASQGSSIEPAQQKAQDNMRENWARIRDRLEEIASSPKIDGRTRAKYNRIDRRRYEDLVSALQSDEKLDADTTSYRDAVELWQRFRTGRATPTADEVQTMRELAKRLTGV